MRPRDLDCVILAGGRATRATYLPYGLPKFLAPFPERPFATEFLKDLEARGVCRAVLALSRPYGAAAISRWLIDEYRGGLSLYCYVAPEPLGITGALNDVARMMAGAHVLVLNADTLIDGLDFQALVDAYASRAPIGLVDADLTPAGMWIVPGDQLRQPAPLGFYEAYGDPAVRFHDIGTTEGWAAALRARGLA